MKIKNQSKMHNKIIKSIIICNTTLEIRKHGYLSISKFELINQTHNEND